MDSIVIHVLNAAALRLGAVPDRGRLEPDLRRHAHREPRPRQPLRVRRLRDRLGGGPGCRRLQASGGEPSQWLLLALLPVGALAAAAVGAVLEPTLLRPFYKRAEEYQLLVTFGLLMILDDVIRFLWGPYPLTASVLFENFGSVNIGESIYPTYNFLVIAVGGLAAVFLWAFIYRTRFGVVLRATSQDMRMASALGVNVNRVYVQAFTLGCLMAGLGGAIIVRVSRPCSAWAWTR